MKSLVLISKNIKESDLLIESFIDNHKIILEDNNFTINNLKNFIDSSFTHLTLVYHFNRNYEIPFFTSNGFNNYNYISDDLYEFIKYAKSIITDLTIDILSCNLKYLGFKNEIKKLEDELNIIIRYSTDFTGNVKGNWILESHNVDVKHLYFNNQITNWKYDLTTAILLADLANPVNASSEYFGHNIVDGYYYLKKDLILPQTFFPDSTCNIELQSEQIFDGKNYTIELKPFDWGLNTGLFSTNNDITTPATIRNLTIHSVDGISNGCGGFMGPSSRFIIIENCISESGGLGDDAGGFVGSNFGQYNENDFQGIYTGQIINCVYKGLINGTYSGGIAGRLCATNHGYVLIKKCSSDGVISGTESGGIVGHMSGYHGDLRITKCYSFGNIDGNGSGGIAGSFLCKCAGIIPTEPKNSFVVIEYSHSEGQINGNNCGGIAGSYAADAQGCMPGSNATLKLDIFTCFSNGNIFGTDCGGIIGPNASFNTKDYSYGSYPLTISRCYSLCDIATSGSGGLCASNFCNIYGKALIEYSYSVGEIGDNNGGLIGPNWSGYINLNECYVQNINKSLTVSITGGGLLGANANSKSITINNCYYESYDSGLNVYGQNCYLEITDIQNINDKMSNLRYSIGTLSFTNWLAGKHYNDIYPKIMNMTIPAETVNAEGYDYRYLTNLRTPVFYYQDPEIRQNEIVFDIAYPGLVDSVLTEDEVIDLRDGMFSYIFSQNPSLNFFIVSKQGMCVDILPISPINRRTNFTSDYYIVYRPNQPAITIDPYDSNVYKGIYCPLPNKNDKFRYISKDDNTNTEWIVERTIDFNFVENKYKYTNNDGISGYNYDSYDYIMIYKYLLYFSGCCFIPHILPPVEITNLVTSSTFSSNIVADITFKNDLYKNPSISAGYKIINYYYSGTEWVKAWENIVLFIDITNDYANFKDTNWASPYVYDNKKYGYRIIGLGINDWYNSAEYYEPVIFNYPYLDVANTQTRETYQEVKIVENGIVSDIKYITGGIVIESSKIPTPKLSKITLNTGSGMIGGPPDNSLNFTWDTPSTLTNKFIVKRYYFINNQYTSPVQYEITDKNFFKDTEWDNTKDIILYTITAIGESSNTNSNESLKMPYYNTNEQVVIIADILCHYFKETDISDKIFFKDDNPNLYNYFKNLSDIELSNKRSKAFCDYFLTFGIDEPYITFDKNLLIFDSKYKRPGYSIINYNYYKNMYGYFKFSDFTFEYDDTGLYIPVSDECPEIIFYTNDNPAESTSEFYKFTKITESNSNIFFALDTGNLNDNYFIPNTDSVFYSLDDIFYINNYTIISGSLTIEDRGRVPCFTVNTKVLTSKGYKNIKNIKIGDYIITPDYRKVQIKNIHINIVKGNSKNYPYIIEKNSIAPNYPIKTFTISGDHLIKYKNKWILPKNIPNLKQDTTQKIIKYYHIELENYETDNLIINDGTIVESFGGYKKYQNVYINRIKNLA